jgi:hypothetical protein
MADLQIGDIVAFTGSDHRWTIMGPVSSATGARTFGLMRKNGEHSFASAQAAETALDLIERPTFQIGEEVWAVDQLGQLAKCTISEFKDSGATVRVLQPATDRPLRAGRANPGDPPKTPGPETADLADVNVAIDAGYSDVPLGMIVVRNRL